MPSDLRLEDVTLLDCTGQDPIASCSVEVVGGVITAIERNGATGPSSMARIDGTGLTLMPGLSDAHVHLALIGPGGTHGSGSWIAHVLEVTRLIEAALLEGFTTVRDAGGLEPAYAREVAAGHIPGPRILPSGSILSQTGGHGDLRAQHEASHCEETIPGLVARTEIVDGADAVRRAAREQLRRGASQIKIFASGGILSPTDPLEAVQFSHDEIAAAVDEAERRGTHVLAHCYSAASTKSALAANVRSIEHASLIDEETAEQIATAHAFVVPTLLTLDELAHGPAGAAITDAQRVKLAQVTRHQQTSVQLLHEAGVSIGSGSDLVGPGQGRRGRELVLKAKLLGNHRAILSATRVNAELFGLADRIGTIQVGKDADLILVRGQPLDHIEALAEPDNIRVVVKGGRVVKDLDRRFRPDD